MAGQTKKEIREEIFARMPESKIVISYLEHYVDLLATMIKYNVESRDITTLTEKELELKAFLDQFLQHSSVDFDNLTSPMEEYKIPDAIQLKADTRLNQMIYLKKLIRANLME